MDVSKIAAEVAQDEEELTFPVFQKNGEPYLAADGSEATCTVLGSDAKRVQKVKDVQMRRLLRLQRSRLDPQDVRNNRIEIAAAAITRWAGWESGDAPFECTPQNVKAWLAADHILVQVEEKVNLPRNFSTSSSTN